MDHFVYIFRNRKYIFYLCLILKSIYLTFGCNRLVTFYFRKILRFSCYFGYRSRICFLLGNFGDL
jgi:hypothetical protein